MRILVGQLTYSNKVVEILMICLQKIINSCILQMGLHGIGQRFPDRVRVFVFIFVYHNITSLSSVGQLELFQLYYVFQLFLPHWKNSVKDKCRKFGYFSNYGNSKTVLKEKTCG
jgi:hypothetical protein